MNRDERERSGRGRNRGTPARTRAHFEREVVLGDQQRTVGRSSKRLILGPAATSPPLTPVTARTNERPRESWREMEQRQASHIRNMSHVFANWHDTKLNVRRVSFMAVDRTFAVLQRRPQLEGISVYDGPPRDRGIYWASENRIEFNRSVLRRRSPREAIKSYLHEVRHAYQFDVIRNPENHPEVSAARVLLWKAAARMYPNVGNNPTYMQAIAYTLNPLEIDARAFAARMFMRVFPGIAHVL